MAHFGAGVFGCEHPFDAGGDGVHLAPRAKHGERVGRAEGARPSSIDLSKNQLWNYLDPGFGLGSLSARRPRAGVRKLAGSCRRSGAAGPQTLVPRSSLPIFVTPTFTPANYP